MFYHFKPLKGNKTCVIICEVDMCMCFIKSERVCVFYNRCVCVMVKEMGVCVCVFVK